MKMIDSKAQYEERLSRVNAYIYDHLDNEIDLNKLAEIACLSPYHWHRIYRAIYGETIAASVKRLRLHRAAGDLAKSSMPIEAVARRSGYKSLQSFTRTFRVVFGMPPAQYRREGSHTKFQTAKQDGEHLMYDITIKKIPAAKAVTIEHIGSYMEIGRTFDRLFVRLGAADQADIGSRMIGIYYDDPGAVPEEKLRARAGIIVEESCAVEAPLELTEISGGAHAVLRHKGPYADMAAAYQWLYGEWLMQSGREAGDAPAFEEFLNNPRDTAPPGPNASASSTGSGGGPGRR